MSAVNPHMLQLPAQNDPVAWARTLAAARGADMITDYGAAPVDAAPLTKQRLDTLLPVARELYNEIARKAAQTESQKIMNIYVHCRQFVTAIESPLPKEPEADAAERWSGKVCRHKATKCLIVPTMIQWLRPVPPEVIGLQLIPPLTVWRLLRDEIYQSMEPDIRHVCKLYHHRMQKRLSSYHTSSVPIKIPRQLRGIRFVDAVLDRAPPLFRVLPPRWTAADTTDLVHETLLAFMAVWTGRPLARLVTLLNPTEKKLVEAEHSCTRQVLNNGTWTPDCDNGRNLEDYRAFARLVNSGNDKPAPAPVPPQTAGAHLQAGSKSRDNTGSEMLDLLRNRASKRQRLEEGASPRKTPRLSQSRSPRPVGPASIDSGADSSSETDPVVMLQFADDDLTTSAQLASGRASPVLEDWKPNVNPLNVNPEVYDNDDTSDRFYLHDPDAPPANDAVDWWSALQFPNEHASLVDGPHGLPREKWQSLWDLKHENSLQPERPASRAAGFLMRSNSAAATFSFTIIPLVAAGAVAVLGMALLVSALIVRLRSRRSACGYS